MKLCGVDEAGRGCVLGPLVMCGVLGEGDIESHLKANGAKDSKLLTAEKREEIFPFIEKTVKYKLIAISPAEIDSAVGGSLNNLNWLEAKHCVEILNDLKPDTAIIDCPSPNCKAYLSYLRERLSNKKITLHVEHKADRNHAIVGAASILAKVTRDREIDKIRKKIGVDFGSGYMSDPKTKKFLQNYWNKYPEIFRHSWASYRDVEGLKSQKKLEEF